MINIGRSITCSCLCKLLIFAEVKKNGRRGCSCTLVISTSCIQLSFQQLRAMVHTLNIDVHAYVRCNTHFILHKYGVTWNRHETLSFWLWLPLCTADRNQVEVLFDYCQEHSWLSTYFKVSSKDLQADRNFQIKKCNYLYSMRSTMQRRNYYFSLLVMLQVCRMCEVIRKRTWSRVNRIQQYSMWSLFCSDIIIS